MTMALINYWLVFCVPHNNGLEKRSITEVGVRWPLSAGLGETGNMVSPQAKITLRTGSKCAFSFWEKCSGTMTSKTWKSGTLMTSSGWLFWSPCFLREISSKILLTKGLMHLSSWTRRKCKTWKTLSTSCQGGQSARSRVEEKGQRGKESGESKWV